MTRINETKLQKMIVESPESFLKGLSISQKEFRLISANDLLSREVHEELSMNGSLPITKCIGKIDLILKYRGETLISEIKYKNPDTGSSDFWDSLKVVGYTEYFKWQTGITKKVFPAIIIPRRLVRLEQKIIANNLKIRLFGVYGIDNLKLELLNQ